MAAEHARTYIALGSNEGNRLALLREAIRRLEGCVTVEQLSDVYETEPAYVADQPRYLNMVIRAATQLDPQALLVCLKGIERAMGRGAGVRWGARPIDLDIVLYGEQQVATPELQIPHARFHERAFVLEPLAELAPELVPPGFNVSIRALAAEAPPFGAILARVGPLDMSCPNDRPGPA